MTDLIHHLEGVRQTGDNRWIARCPAHDDGSPSLSIRELDDGRTLIHCFAGCDALSVLHAVDLEMADLFPERLNDQLKPTRSQIPARDLLTVLSSEALTVGTISGQFMESRELDEDSWQRLATAVSRINKVVSHG